MAGDDDLLSGEGFDKGADVLVGVTVKEIGKYVEIEMGWGMHIAILQDMADIGVMAEIDGELSILL